MIPLKDDNPTRTVPVVTLVIIAVNVFVYLTQLTMGPRTEWLFVHRFGVIPRALVTFQDPFPTDGLPVFLTLGTSLFLHGGFVHLAGNMLFLWIFGNNIEDFFGHIRFVAFYLFCGVAASAFHILAAPGSVTPLVGASGAIAGVMGGYLLLYPRARILTLILIIFYPVLIWVPAVVFLVLWLALQFFNAGSAGDSGVAWLAHIGGFFCGVVIVKMLVKKRRATGTGPRSGNRSVDEADHFEFD